jgi:hypothetical protein
LKRGGDDPELAHLLGVMTGKDGDDLARAGNAPGMQQGGREPRIVAVKLGLARAIRVHDREKR